MGTVLNEGRLTADITDVFDHIVSYLSLEKVHNLAGSFVSQPVNSFPFFYGSHIPSQ